MTTTMHAALQLSVRGDPGLWRLDTHLGITKRTALQFPPLAFAALSLGSAASSCFARAASWFHTFAVECRERLRWPLRWTAISRPDPSVTAVDDVRFTLPREIVFDPAMFERIGKDYPSSNIRTKNVKVIFAEKTFDALRRVGERRNSLPQGLRTCVLLTDYLDGLVADGGRIIVERNGCYSELRLR